MTGRPVYHPGARAWQFGAAHGPSLAARHCRGGYAVRRAVGRAKGGEAYDRAAVAGRSGRAAGPQGAYAALPVGSAARGPSRHRRSARRSNTRCACLPAAMAAGNRPCCAPRRAPTGHRAPESGSSFSRRCFPTTAPGEGGGGMSSGASPSGANTRLRPGGNPCSGGVRRGAGAEVFSAAGARRPHDGLDGVGENVAHAAPNRVRAANAAVPLRGGPGRARA